MTLAVEKGPTDVRLLEDTIPENLAKTVATHPDREALVSVHQGIRWTYAEFAAQVDQLARGLLGLGIEKGDRVGLWSPNYAEWTLVQYATAAVGAILVNVNPAYRSYELAYVLQQSGTRTLISAPTFKTSDYVAVVDEVRKGGAELDHAIFLWTPEWEALF